MKDKVDGIYNPGAKKWAARLCDTIQGNYAPDLGAILWLVRYLQTFAKMTVRVFAYQIMRKFNAGSGKLARMRIFDAHPCSLNAYFKPVETGTNDVDGLAGTNDAPGQGLAGTKDDDGAADEDSKYLATWSKAYTAACECYYSHPAQWHDQSPTSSSAAVGLMAITEWADGSPSRGPSAN